MKTTRTLLFASAAIAAFALNTNVRADDLAAAAAKASAVVNRPIVASPHGLEEFPWLLQGYSPQTAAKNPTQAGRLSSTNAPAVAPHTVRD
jgi:hypothetical protein